MTDDAKSDVRLEKDTFGEIAVPNAKLWGAQTQRSLQNFKISSEKQSPELITALAIVKRAAAEVNLDLKVLDAAKARAIIEAADEIIDGKHPDEFPLAVWQTGSGTQTNMNLNEVIANRASELMGGQRGEERLVHPNDDVNRGQSSNDVFPTAMHVAAAYAIVKHLVPSLQDLARYARQESRRRSSTSSRSAARTCRTRRRSRSDRRFSGYVAQLDHGIRHVEATLPHLYRAGAGRHGGRHRAERASRIRGEGGGRDRQADGPALRDRAEQVRSDGRRRRARCGARRAEDRSRRR